MLIALLLVNVCVSEFKINNGSVAEWSKAAVLKTVGGKTSVGSNPTASAISDSSEVCLQCKQIGARGKFDYSVYKMNTEGWVSGRNQSLAKGPDQCVSRVRIPPLLPILRRCTPRTILGVIEQVVL